MLLGMVWGTPVRNWLGRYVESTVVDLGFLGLLLLIYEGIFLQENLVNVTDHRIGGLTTSLKSLKANFRLSLLVALTGVCLPIGMSFILMVLTGATPLQAIAAGASLCSTSLGTTFTVMEASGLTATRMGVVLSSAAMIDDVIGKESISLVLAPGLTNRSALVMVQVITNLGSSASFNAMAVIRPIFVSLGFALAVPMFCHFVVLPLTKRLTDRKMMPSDSMLSKLLGSQESAFVVHTAILVGMITGANYAGTSSLFAAYLSGAAITWWDSEVPHGSPCFAEERTPKPKAVPREDVNTNPNFRFSPESLDDRIMTAPPVKINADQNIKQTTSCQSVAAMPQDNVRIHGDRHSQTSGVIIFEKYYQQTLHRILKPFFFASIGFSVPITRMFAGSVVWRGLIYTALMILGKLLCGLWLVRLNVPGLLSPFTRARKLHSEKTNPTALPPSRIVDTKIDRPEAGLKNKSKTQQANTSVKLDRSSKHPHRTPEAANPVSIYPGGIVGCAMVARGEIGFLISSLAEMNGIFGEEANGHVFLIVTWAILLCTILGLIGVGFMVRRLKRLSEGKGSGSGRDVLGAWGLA